MRKPFVCGNWKLNQRLPEANALIEQIVAGLSTHTNVEVAVAPVATVLFSACAKAKGSSLGIAAQNVFFAEQGAFTGEWSVGHLVELGCQYAIIGHSERRQYFNETDDSVAKKAKACFAGGLIPIVCVGESENQREQGQTDQVLNSQLSPVLDMLSSAEVSQMIVAYEPVWAIGTGKSASAELAGSVHAFLRSQIEKSFESRSAENVRIIYGGSVKPENAAELRRQKDIDGFLVGGASLLAETFLQIVKNARAVSVT